MVDNKAGGIKTVGSTFDITNTIIARNGLGTDSGGVEFGGVRLGALPDGSGPPRFANNTVVDNMFIGISCQLPYDVSTNIFYRNVGGGAFGCMTAAECCGSMNPDPKLDASYHLMTGSPCIDKLGETGNMLVGDIDGQTRPWPAGGKLDCGADEFTP